jgi:hypothetical protein
VTVTDYLTGVFAAQAAIGLLYERDAWDYHFMAHHWMHNTATALGALEARRAKGSMQEVFAEHRDD